MKNDDLSERMRADWNKRALEDAHYYVAFAGRDQDEAAFLASAAEVVQLLETELERLPPQANPRAWRALEIGCGPGRLMKPLSSRFGEIHGVDVSDKMIGRARERLRDIPHAHVHVSDGASLAQFADESFDFVYSNAVFQHIPSREVIYQYMRETRRVLKPGGFFHGQFKGVPHPAATDTWSGAFVSADDIRTFTRENGFQLLNLDGIQTQYMWTTWRKKPVPHAVDVLPACIRRITNGISREPVASVRGRYSCISLWVDNLPAECELNNLEVAIDGVNGTPFYVGPRLRDGEYRIKVWLPEGARTGLLPVVPWIGGQSLCPPSRVRVIPGGPLIPRIVSITDGINIVESYRSTSGLVKVQTEETSPESVTVTIAGLTLQVIDIVCMDPVTPRHELNLRIPAHIRNGSQIIEIRVGERRLAPAEIEIAL